jgi:hypothetical protein
MPKKSVQDKAAPLSAKDIKRVIFERDHTIAGLAREWNVPVWNLKAVIYRYAGAVLPKERQLLADYIGCDVSQIGRDSARSEHQQAEAAA